MNIVCGDALGVSCGTWIAFWNGSIGAFFAAVTGALVALLVVRLTNAQQRHGVERTVEIAAVADIVAAMEELVWAVKHRYGPESAAGADVGSSIRLMRAAITRLEMSGASGKLVASVITHWPSRLFRLVTAHEVALIRPEALSRDEVLLVLEQAAGAAQTFLPMCSRGSKTERKVGLKKLSNSSQRLTYAVEQFDVVVDATVGWLAQMAAETESK